MVFWSFKLRVLFLSCLSYGLLGLRTLVAWPHAIPQATCPDRTRQNISHQLAWSHKTCKFGYWELADIGNMPTYGSSLVLNYARNTAKIRPFWQYCRLRMILIWCSYMWYIMGSGAAPQKMTNIWKRYETNTKSSIWIKIPDRLRMMVVFSINWCFGIAPYQYIILQNKTLSYLSECHGLSLVPLHAQQKSNFDCCHTWAIAL